MRISRLYVYPVKGCRAVAVDETALGPLGLEHDRRFAFVGADGRAVTQREQPLLATIRPTVEENALRLDFGGLTETAIAFDDFRARAVPLEAASDYLGMRMALVMLDADALRSFADSKPVLVTTMGRLAELNIPGVGMERFRPNVVLEGTEQWRELRGRDAVLEYVEPCSRCEVTTIDQASGARRGPEPLRTAGEIGNKNVGGHG